jgi:hypothetical protein
MGRLCYQTQHPGTYPGTPPRAGPVICPGARRVWHVFLQSWYKFYYVLAPSRYKFDRRREFIPGYKVGCGHWRSVGVRFVSEPEIYQGLLSLNWGQMRESGCMNNYKSVLGAGAKAKTVTNNLPILSVLAFRARIKTVKMQNIYHDS